VTDPPASQAEIDDAERAAMALIRARHEGRDGDETAILAGMTHRELLVLTLKLTGLAQEAIVRICALRSLVTDEDALEEVLSTPVSEMNPDGLEMVSEMLAEVHQGIT
jgi:hypothetical protein